MSQTAARLQPTVAEQPRAKIQAKQVEAPRADMSTNQIAKIALNPNERDDAKVQTLAKTIDAKTLRDLQAFSAYIAETRTLAQRRLLELTSTTAFSRLQSVIGGLQGGVVDFDDMMRPMTDDLEAAFVLRTNNQMNNAIRQIKEDVAKEAEWQTERERIAAETATIAITERTLNADVARLGQDTNWWGNVKGASLRAIEAKNLELQALAPRRTKLAADATKVDDEQREYEARTGEYKKQKERLRRMLDLGPGYVKRVEDIVKKAISFIDDSSREVGAVRGEFDELETQAGNVLKANAQMVRVTAILDKGIDGANELHKNKVKALSVVPPNEDTLAAVTRTQEKNDVERFVTALSETSTSTKKNVTALQEDAVTANTFSDGVMRQQTNLRELHGDGIASITTNLNMALQAFNMAALTEAGNNAWQAMGDMNKVTNRIRDNQVVQSAMQLDDTNRRIIEKFDSLSGISTALQEANKLRADGISNIASSLKELQEKTDEVGRSLQVSIGMDAAADPVATVTTGNGKAEPAKKVDDLMLFDGDQTTVH